MGRPLGVTGRRQQKGCGRAFASADVESTETVEQVVPSDLTHLRPDDVVRSGDCAHRTHASVQSDLRVAEHRREQSECKDGDLAGEAQGKRFTTIR